MILAGAAWLGCPVKLPCLTQLGAGLSICCTDSAVGRLGVSPTGRTSCLSWRVGCGTPTPATSSCGSGHWARPTAERLHRVCQEDYSQMLGHNLLAGSTKTGGNCFLTGAKGEMRTQHIARYLRPLSSFSPSWTMAGVPLPSGCMWMLYQLNTQGLTTAQWGAIGWYPSF